MNAVVTPQKQQLLWFSWTCWNCWRLLIDFSDTSRRCHRKSLTAITFKFNYTEGNVVCSQSNDIEILPKKN